MATRPRHRKVSATPDLARAPVGLTMTKVGPVSTDRRPQPQPYAATASRSTVFISTGESFGVATGIPR